MRSVHLTDLNIATRVLMAAKECHRQTLAQDIIANARIADKFRKKTGRNHVKWGAGSLADACRHLSKARRLQDCDPLYLRCLATVVAALRIP